MCRANWSSGKSSSLLTCKQLVNFLGSSSSKSLRCTRFPLTPRCPGPSSITGTLLGSPASPVCTPLVRSLLTIKHFTPCAPGWVDLSQGLSHLSHGLWRGAFLLPERRHPKTNRGAAAPTEEGKTAGGQKPNRVFHPAIPTQLQDNQASLKGERMVAPELAGKASRRKGRGWAFAEAQSLVISRGGL